MANKYIQDRGYATTFTGRSAGEAAAALTAKKVEDYERFLEEQEEALEQEEKKSAFGSLGGLAFGLGAGLLTGGASLGLQAAVTGGATLLGRGAGSAIAGPSKKLIKSRDSLFGAEKYKAANIQMKKLREARTQSAFSSALTNALTSGIFGKLQSSAGLLDAGGSYNQISQNVLGTQGVNFAGTTYGVRQSALQLNTIPEDTLKILQY